MSENPSAKHSRRRSVPPSFGVSVKDLGESSPRSKTTYNVDSFSIKNNWDRFGANLTAAISKKKQFKLEDDAWKRQTGLRGDLFWGYWEPRTAHAFFISKFERRKTLAITMLSLVTLGFISEVFLCPTQNNFNRYFSALASVISASLLATLLNWSVVLTEERFSLAMLSLSVLEAVQNPSLWSLWENRGRPYLHLDAIFTANGPDALHRRIMFIVYFTLFGIQSFLFYVRPVYTLSFSLVSYAALQMPAFCYFYFHAREYNDDLEIFITIIGPMVYMTAACMLLGIIFYRSERVEFEQMVLNRDMAEHVKCVANTLNAPTDGQGEFSAPLGGRRGSASSLPSDLRDCFSNFAQESFMERRIRAFQRIKQEYSVRRNPVVMSLIDICIWAMAANVNQRRDSNPNWEDFFSSKKESDDRQGKESIRTLSDFDTVLHQSPSIDKFGVLKSSKGAPLRCISSTSSPSSDLGLAQKPHNLNVFGIGSDPTSKIDSCIGNAKQLPRSRRSSSAEDFVSKSPLIEYSSTPDSEQDLVLRSNLERHMRDWNFGTTEGIWTSLFSESTRAPLYSDPLRTVAMQALVSLNVFDDGTLHLDEKTCRNFLGAVEAGYRPRGSVPYHNALHAADVVQTIFSILSMDQLHLSCLAKFAMIIGAAIHDLGHPGSNNKHLIESRHELATLYNDTSPLENYHVSEAFRIMRSNPKLNILASLEAKGLKAQCTELRNLLIDMVLATDLNRHFEQQAKMITLLEAKRLRSPRGIPEDSETEGSHHDENMSLDSPSAKDTKFDAGDITIICSTLLHAADVSNVAKSWKAYKPWKDLLFEEMFALGDQERKLGMKVQPLMDREICIPANAQIDFINKIVLPLFQDIRSLIPFTSTIAVRELELNVRQLQRLAGRALGPIDSSQDDESSGEESKKDR